MYNKLLSQQITIFQLKPYKYVMRSDRLLQGTALSPIYIVSSGPFLFISKNNQYLTVIKIVTIQVAWDH